jgi:hypothetical protein
MALDPVVSPLFNFVIAADLTSLREIRDRALDEPTIGAFQSILQFLPEDVEASRNAVEHLRQSLEGFEVTTSAGPLDPSRFAAAVSRVETALADASDDAFTAGLGELAAGLEQARSEAEATLAALARADSGHRQAIVEAEARLRVWTGRAIDDLRDAAQTPPPTLGSLPASIRERFMTRSGRFLGMLQPVGDVFDPTFLDEYVAASRRVSSEATGFPVVFHQMSMRIAKGFYRAVVVGAILVFVILLIDYRELRATLLAMIPLSIGVLWMLGGMRLFGLSFNFANLVGVPLILGVGIDNGVHVVHRLRLEGGAGMSTVLRHTGRAILIASLTTMIGFGSLALASHQGIASLGKILLLGVGACLVTATVVLPNVLVAAGGYRR